MVDLGYYGLILLEYIYSLVFCESKYSVTTGSTREQIMRIDFLSSAAFAVYTSEREKKNIYLHSVSHQELVRHFSTNK